MLMLSRQHYAQAWAFFRFLLTERPESLRVYLQRVANRPAGRRGEDVLLSEFIDVFGAPESLELGVERFCRPPDAIRFGGSVRRIARRADIRGENALNSPGS